MENHLLSCDILNWDLKQTRTATPTSGGKKNVSPESSYKHIFTLVTLYVSIFGKIPLTPAFPSERNDGR